MAPLAAIAGAAAAAAEPQYLAAWGALKSNFSRSSGDDCSLQDTQQDCASTAQDGQPCTWCTYLDGLFGMCMDPGYDCGGESPSPSPSPSPTGQQHYGQPPCRSDELTGEVEDVGELCAPQCDALGGCARDVDPSCTEPSPQCILQDSDGNEYCGLTCGDGEGNCPTGASCWFGVCAYPGVASRDANLFVLMKKHDVVV